MMLGLRCNNHSAVRYLIRHLKGAIRQGEVMDTQSGGDLCMPLLADESGTVK